MPSLWYGTSGPKDSPIVIVGEAWGEQEARMETPFVGASGQELNRILREAGINRSQCFVTNTSAFQPKGNDYSLDFLLDTDPNAKEYAGLFPSEKVKKEIERLYEQIFSFPRKLVIAVGNYALWALSNKASISSTRSNGRRIPAGIDSQRGSMLYVLNSRFTPSGDSSIPLLPIYHPAFILRKWSLRNIVLMDLRIRVPLALKQQWSLPSDLKFNASPSFFDVKNFFSSILSKLEEGIKTPLVVDIETTQQRIITCIGFGTSINNIISIPFVKREGERILSFWPDYLEAVIVKDMLKVLLHPNIQLIGQNFNYDRQFFLSHWGANLTLFYDCMVAQHLIWPGLPKSLDFQASMYSTRYYRYWKEDRKVDETSEKDWNVKTSLERLLEYNCMDIYYTFICWQQTSALIKHQKLEALLTECMEVNDITYEMSTRGVKVDLAKREKVKQDLLISRKQIQDFLLKMVPQEFVDPDAKTLWFKSAAQRKVLFGEILNLPLPINHKTGTPTLGKTALAEMELKFPLYRKIFEALRLEASLGVFESTFLSPSLESDNFLRSSFNSCGAYTFRFSSNKNPFGRGANLQNIPKGK